MIHKYETRALSCSKYIACLLSNYFQSRTTKANIIPDSKLICHDVIRRLPFNGYENECLHLPLNIVLNTHIILNLLNMKVL